MECRYYSDIHVFAIFTGQYSLSVVDQDANKGRTVKHYRIRNLDSGGFYITTRRKFDALPEMVEFYKGET